MGMNIPSQASPKETTMSPDTLQQQPQSFPRTVKNLCTFAAALILTAAACFLLSAT